MESVAWKLLRHFVPRNDNSHRKRYKTVELIINEKVWMPDTLIPATRRADFKIEYGETELRNLVKQADLLASPKRGFFTITPKGVELLAKKPEKIDVSILEQFPEFIDFKNRKKEKNDTKSQAETSIAQDSTQTPEDALASASKQLRFTLEAEVISSVKDASPSFFERLVVDLLVKMGYGGNRQDAGKPLERVVTVELMASLTKIDSAWMLFIYKPSAGKAQLAALKYKNLLGRYKANALEKAYS